VRKIVLGVAAVAVVVGATALALGDETAPVEAETSPSASPTESSSTTSTPDLLPAGAGGLSLLEAQSTKGGDADLGTFQVAAGGQVVVALRCSGNGVTVLVDGERFITSNCAGWTEQDSRSFDVTDAGTHTVKVDAVGQENWGVRVEQQ